MPIADGGRGPTDAVRRRLLTVAPGAADTVKPRGMTVAPGAAHTVKHRLLTVAAPVSTVTDRPSPLSADLSIGAHHPQLACCQRHCAEVMYGMGRAKSGKNRRKKRGQARSLVINKRACPLFFLIRRKTAKISWRAQGVGEWLAARTRGIIPWRCPSLRGQWARKETYPRTLAGGPKHAQRSLVFRARHY
jgi:hypothetical protein